MHLVRLPHVRLVDHVLAPSFGLLFTGVLFGHGCIRQVLELVLGISWVVVLGSEADVWGFPNPDRQRFNATDEHPLTNVELLIQDHQRSLYVLLDDPDADVCSNLHPRYDVA